MQVTFFFFPISFFLSGNTDTKDIKRDAAARNATLHGSTPCPGGPQRILSKLRVSDGYAQGSFLFFFSIFFLFIFL